MEAYQAKDIERVEVMARHYIIAAIWADAPEGTHPRATKQAMGAAHRDCLTFCHQAGPDLLREVMRAHADGYGAHPDCGTEHPVFAAMGHDLWLTRNGHGVGFWDRDALKEGDLGDRRSDVARAMGAHEPEFYRGWLYLS
jgi:hypothetical protein